VVPLADVGNTAVGYLVGAPNDYLAAWGPPTGTIRGLLLLATALAVGLGFGIQQRLYQETTLTARAYGLLTALFLGALVGVAAFQN
jgi:hypothetical protein